MSDVKAQTRNTWSRTRNGVRAARSASVVLRRVDASPVPRDGVADQHSSHAAGPPGDACVRSVRHRNQQLIQLRSARIGAADRVRCTWLCRAKNNLSAADMLAHSRLHTSCSPTLCAVLCLTWFSSSEVQYWWIAFCPST